MSRSTNRAMDESRRKASESKPALPFDGQSTSFSLFQTSISLSSVPSSISNTTVILHATNAFGTWSAGFALALRKIYPAAEQIYKSYCDGMRPSANAWPTRELVGKCIVIPPQPDDPGNVWIACVFTSYGYGSRAVRGAGKREHAAKDGAETVVESTKSALKEFRGWIASMDEEKDKETSGDGGGGGRDDPVEGKEAGNIKSEASKAVIYSPKFNSGNFGVDWDVTAGIIRDVFGDWEGEWRLLADR